MTPYKPYEKYKDSGIPWLGKIPEHWEVQKSKWVFNREKREVRLDDDVVTAFRDGQVTLRKKRRTDGFTIAIQEHGYQGIRKGDLVIHGMDAFAGAIGVSDSDGKASPVYNACTLKSNGDIWYYCWIVRQMSKAGFIESLAKGIRERSTDFRFDIFSEQLLPIPSPEEQTAIARFLDYKLAKINRFIRKKKQLIKLLNEQKAAIINQAVTKGLDPNAGMKDSGIEWLGEIPQHWEVVKLTGVCDIVRGNSSFKKDELLNDGKYVALQYGKTYKVDEVNDGFQFYVNDEFYKDSQTVKYDDVIIISTSETIEDLGHSVFYNRHDLGLLGGEQVLLRPKNGKVNGKYLCYSSKGFAKELRKYATGVKVYRFNIDDLKTIYTSVPPFQSQVEIVNFIEIESQRINTTISTIEKEIALVEEYKTALIAEAVTGKIDVRGYEVPELESEEEGYEELEDEMSMVAEDADDYQTEEME